ncbi:MAG: DNA photolyase [Planctomycetes bacterium]|nr:DNA photolyase [Planctomycetota bacterium]
MTEAWKENNMRCYEYRLKTGITRTLEFARKLLAWFAVNVGLRCGHNCLYCSTGAVLRTHPCFRALGESPFGHGYCIVDPSTPERVARDAARLRERGLIQLCTLTDAWAPEAKKLELGRRCLEAILAQPGWTVRILTKSAAVREDFGSLEKHRDRVLVGLSLTAMPEKSPINNILEPNASDIRDRMAAMTEAAARGLRVYGMLCPFLPGIADAPEDIDQLVTFVVGCRAQEIFVEAVNPRGPGLLHCQEALQARGNTSETAAIARIRRRQDWSQYCLDLVRNVQAGVRRHFDIGKLRFLLYPSGLLPGHEAAIHKDDAGVVWLGKSPTTP